MGNVIGGEIESGLYGLFLALGQGVKRGVLNIIVVHGVGGKRVNMGAAFSIRNRDEARKSFSVLWSV